MPRFVFLKPESMLFLLIVSGASGGRPAILFGLFGSRGFGHSYLAALRAEGGRFIDSKILFHQTSADLFYDRRLFVSPFYSSL